MLVWSVIHQEHVLAALGGNICWSQCGDVEVKVSVVVEIRGGGCEGVEGTGDTPIGCLVCEGAVAVVDEEVVGEHGPELEDVVVAVVVEVTRESRADHG